MADIEEGTGGKELAVETPVGKIQLKGYHLGNLLQVITAALLALMLYMIYDAKVNAKAASEELAKVTKESGLVRGSESKAEHAALQASIDRSTEIQAEANYILTLSPREREALNLRMPDSLRNKIYGKDLRDRYSR